MESNWAKRQHVKVPVQTLGNTLSLTQARVHLAQQSVCTAARARLGAFQAGAAAAQACVSREEGPRCGILWNSSLFAPHVPHTSSLSTPPQRGELFALADSQAASAEKAAPGSLSVMFAGTARLASAQIPLGTRPPAPLSNTPFSALLPASSARQHLDSALREGFPAHGATEASDFTGVSSCFVRKQLTGAQAEGKQWQEGSELQGELRGTPPARKSRAQPSPALRLVIFLPWQSEGWLERLTRRQAVLLCCGLAGLIYFLQPRLFQRSAREPPTVSYTPDSGEQGAGPVLNLTAWGAPVVWGGSLESQRRRREFETQAVRTGLVVPLYTFPYEKREDSKAFVDDSEGDYYYTSEFFGGLRAEVYQLALVCSRFILQDMEKSFHAFQFEESYLNRPTRVLSPEYSYWDAPGTPDIPVKRILSLQRGCLRGPESRESYC
ncbi:GBGT1 acetylgalactosaminyltransferase, partial [Atractosteus spatula]|nr:GBGT1 acetylgalactosaminyltransferase [Atractosteus spatula]